MNWENVQELSCQIANAVTRGDKGAEMGLRRKLERYIARWLAAKDLTAVQTYNLKATLADFGECGLALSRLQEAFEYARAINVPSAIIDSIFSMAEHYYLEADWVQLDIWRKRGEKLLSEGLMDYDRSERTYWKDRFRSLNRA